MNPPINIQPASLGHAACVIALSLQRELSSNAKPQRHHVTCSLYSSPSYRCTVGGRDFMFVCMVGNLSPRVKLLNFLLGYICHDVAKCFQLDAATSSATIGTPIRAIDVQYVFLNSNLNG